MSWAVSARTQAGAAGNRAAWALVFGFAVLALPTAISFAGQEWSRDYGAHEPIVLLVGAWIFWRRWPYIRAVARPGQWIVASLALAGALPIYVFGRAYDVPPLEAAGLYGAGVALLYADLGARALVQAWPALLFLVFAIPPPRMLLDSLTGPLKEVVSAVATSVLRLLGLPVAVQGVVIFVAQYELLVEDACAGMNSLIGLTALSLLYGYVRYGASLPRILSMAALAVPVAVAANVVRVALLVLLTYAYGDALAQGFMHFAAGLVLFLTALALVVVIDRTILCRVTFTPRR